MSRARMSRLLFAGLATLALLAGMFWVAPVGKVSANELAHVSVALMPQADTASLNDGVDTYLVTLTSHTPSDARYATARIPFNSEYRLANASFNRDDIWVSAVGEDFVEVSVVHLIGNRDYATAMLRFVSVGPTERNALVERASVTWRDDTNMPHNHSNLPVAHQAATLSPFATLYDGSTVHSFSANPFASGEPVNLWYTSPSGESTRLVYEDGMAIPPPRKCYAEDVVPTCNESLDANGMGEFQVRIKLPANLEPGTYTMVARGGWSGTQASAPFVVR
jgi:hypothetical protein